LTRGVPGLDGDLDVRVLLPEVLDASREPVERVLAAGGERAGQRADEAELDLGDLVATVSVSSPATTGGEYERHGQHDRDRSDTCHHPLPPVQSVPRCLVVRRSSMALEKCSSSFPGSALPTIYIRNMDFSRSLCAASEIAP